MVVPDPSAELLALVRGHGDPAPDVAAAADRRTADLVRRRFGLALPPPFVGRPGPEEPVRVATAADGAAIAAVKWRVFGTSYRSGVLPDDFLDRREVVPPASFWTGRALVPPSRRHRLLVWGRPGTVFGYADVGPVHPDDAEPGRPEAGEVYELYVDPSAQGAGGGTRLLAAARDWLTQVGFARLELSTLATNVSARRFYAAHGWVPTGAVAHVDLGTVAFDEMRYALPPSPGPP
ncbi:MAG: family N-acetyltransferase [Acidimicrobiales bacterium]|nr:family N-acetyltransferase [Acidimicrobiales bacterium]